MTTENLVEIIYLEFDKAFSTVPCAILLSKLEKCKLHKITITWINYSLNNRKQRVSANGWISDWQDVSSGAPKMSVLGAIFLMTLMEEQSIF